MSDASKPKSEAVAAATLATAAAKNDHHPDGYRAPPYLTPVFVAVTASALWLNEYPLHWLGIKHVFVLVAMMFLTVVHEQMQPFCCTFAEICMLSAQVAWTMARVIVQYVLRGCKPKFPEWTLAYELFLAKSFVTGESGGANVIKPNNVVVYRRLFESGADAMRRIYCRYYEATTEFFQHNGLEHMWVKSATASSTTSITKRVVVLYYHGGGYVFGSPRSYAYYLVRVRDHVAKAIAKVQRDGGNAEQPVQVDVLAATYRKIPEHRYPVPVDDSMTMYDYLVNEEKVSPSQIVVAGDSAAGGLVMSVLLRLRNVKREMPAASIVVSPWGDMLADVARAENCFLPKTIVDSFRDHCLVAALAANPSNPEAAMESLQEAVSAKADLTGLPPLFILAGDFDVLYQQSLSLAENAKRHGVDVELDVHKHMPHVFCFLPGAMIPHSEIGITNLAAFAAKKLVHARET